MIELLISLALLSIIMVMVVQFMSSTAGAQKKTKENIKVQTEAKEVMTNIMDGLVTASYVQVRSKNGVVYTMNKTTGSRKEALSPATGSISVIPTSSTTIVPDNFGNYNKMVDADGNYIGGERKVIVDMDTFQLPGEKVADGNYPLKGDLHRSAISDARSFRILKQEVAGNDTYLYIEPLYIYAEYNIVGPGGTQQVESVMYKFVDNAKGNISIYLSRNTWDRNTASRWYTALISTSTSDDTGLLTKNLSDFYLSADAEGNALMIDALFDIKGYKYNAAETVKFRNSSVLTVRPQNLYKKVNIGGGGATP